MNVPLIRLSTAPLPQQMRSMEELSDDFNKRKEDTDTYLTKAYSQLDARITVLEKKRDDTLKKQKR